MNNVISDMVKLLTIIANSDGIGIRELSKITNVPMAVIKKNLEYIWSNHELYLVNLVPEEEYEEDFMDTKWTIDGFVEGTRILELNCLEKYLYKNIVTNDTYEYDSFLGIKTKSIYSLEDYKYKLCQVTMAIRNRKKLLVKYRGKSASVQDFIIEPLAVVFYEFDNILYVLGQYNKIIYTYRLDRIVGIKETKDNFIPIKEFNIEKYLCNIWGMEQGEGKKVKVKFINTGNVLYKAKRDLECRKNKKLIEYPDCIIYEDIVIGINSFKNWLRTYGGAAVVLEPKELREEMIESAKRCLEYYLQ